MQKASKSLEMPEELFDEFQEEPVASGSVGQVHRARLRPEHALDGPGGQLRDVAVKIQHPGVIDSAFMEPCYCCFMLFYCFVCQCQHWCLKLAFLLRHVIIYVICRRIIHDNCVELAFSGPEYRVEGGRVLGEVLAHDHALRPE